MTDFSSLCDHARPLLRVLDRMDEPVGEDIDTRSRRIASSQALERSKRRLPTLRTTKGDERPPRNRCAGKVST